MATADCVGGILLAPRAGAFVVLHAGWRGILAGIVEASIASLREASSAPPSEMILATGPAVGGCCYEVGEEVRAAFLERDGAAGDAFLPTRPGHWRLDLYAIARQRLAAMGVHAVQGGAYCTHTEHRLFYSYRRDQATQRMAGCIWRV